MFLPEINETHADYVLTYTKQQGNGLDSLVRKMGLNEDNTMLEADLQPDLIQSFSSKFPEANLEELDNIVKWILITSFAKLKENKEWKRMTH
jgi:hypothetical protein